MAPKQTPIRLPDELRQRIDREVERLGLSMNAVIIMHLDRSLPPLRAGAPAEAPQRVAEPDGDDVADFD